MASPAGTVQPASRLTSSGTPAIAVAITGRPLAIASIKTIGRPSAKDGRISAWAESSAFLTPASSCQPVRVMRGPRPYLSINPMIWRRNSPSPTSIRRKSGKAGAAIAIASTNRPNPFCAEKRPIATRCGPPCGKGTGSGKRSGSIPQCTTLILSQCDGATQRHSWLRPKEEIATTKAAPSILSRNDSDKGASNSSGPCTVKL